MSELAFNINGEAFEVPPQATGWRVRRMRAKGSPEVVYGRDGMPLVLPIDAELDDLRAEVNTAGRYRLDLVDQNNKAITDVSSGYVQVNTEAPALTGTSTAITSVLPKQPSDNIVIEALRTQSAMALAVIERFPQMMDSAANLLRAADGAGIPARAPRDVEDDEEEIEEVAPAAPPKNEWIPFLQGLMPFAFELFKGSNLKLPGGLAALFDCRRAAPTNENKSTEQPAKRTAAPASSSTPPAAPAAAKALEDDDTKLPPLDPSTMGHFLAIQNALAPHEAALAQEVAASLGPAEVRAWFQELRTLNVPDAVAKIRTLIGTKAGGAS